MGIASSFTLEKARKHEWHLEKNKINCLYCEKKKKNLPKRWACRVTMVLHICVSCSGSEDKIRKRREIHVHNNPNTSWEFLCFVFINIFFLLLITTLGRWSRESFLNRPRLHSDPPGAWLSSVNTVRWLGSDWSLSNWRSARGLSLCWKKLGGGGKQTDRKKRIIKGGRTKQEEKLLCC